MMLTIPVSSSGAAAAASIADDVVGGGRQQHHPADNLIHRMQLEVEARDHAEVAAAAANRPEQIGMRAGIHLPDLAIGGDKLDAEQAVDGHAVFAGQIPYSPAERDAADPDRSGIAEASGQAMLGGRLRIFNRGQARASPDGARVGLDLERIQIAQVEQDAALGRAEKAVPAVANRQRQAARARDAHGLRDVSRAGRPDDHRRATIDPAGKYRPQLVVTGIFRPDHAAVQLILQ